MQSPALRLAQRIAADIVAGRGISHVLRARAPLGGEIYVEIDRVQIGFPEGEILAPAVDVEQKPPLLLVAHRLKPEAAKLDPVRIDHGQAPDADAARIILHHLQNDGRCRALAGVYRRLQKYLPALEAPLENAVYRSSRKGVTDDEDARAALSQRGKTLLVILPCEHAALYERGKKYVLDFTRPRQNALLVGSLFMVYPSARYHKRAVYLLA